MGTVKIIGQNSGLTIRMDCRQWQDQAVELEAKLRLLKTRDGHPAEVFFDSDPGAERLKQLFEILQATGCVCRGLYIQKKPEVPGNLTVIPRTAAGRRADPAGRRGFIASRCAPADSDRNARQRTVDCSGHGRRSDPPARSRLPADRDGTGSCPRQDFRQRLADSDKFRESLCVL